MNGKTSCTRCGTCCKKGGPAFHQQDRLLIEKGIILSKDLYTIRKGEPVYDNVKEQTLSAESDIIKIRSRKGSRACIFFDETEKHCDIYDNRPLECKVMKCWDTREIERIYRQNRLTREDILGEIRGLWDLIQYHQTRCDYEKFGFLLIKDSDNGKANDMSALIDEITRYDTGFRELMAEKSGIDPEMLDFLLGRPVTVVVSGQL